MLRQSGYVHDIPRPISNISFKGIHSGFRGNITSSACAIKDRAVGFSSLRSMWMSNLIDTLLYHTLASSHLGIIEMMLGLLMLDLHMMVLLMLMLGYHLMA